MNRRSMLAVMGAAALAAGCAGLQGAREQAGYVQKEKGFDFAAVQANPQQAADQYVKVDSKKTEPVKKVFIWSFRAKFLKQAGATATGGALSGGAKASKVLGLKGVDTPDFQSITDQMHQQLVAELQSQGYEVIPAEELSKNAAYQELAADSHPDAGIASEEFVIASPRGVKLAKQQGDPGVGTFESVKIGMRVDKVKTKLAVELGAAPIVATIEVPFVRFAGTKGVFKLGSGAQVSWRPQLSVGATLGVNCNPHKSGTYLQGFANASLKDNIISDADFTSGIEQGKMGLFKGTHDAYVAKPDVYKAEVIKAYGTACKLLALKVKQATETK